MSSSSLSTIKNISNLSVVESKTWSQEHTIIFDQNNRKAGLEILKEIKDGTRLCIGYSNNVSVSGLVSYQHWFIMTNDESCTKYFIEFGSIDLDYDNARVDINLAPRRNITILSEFQFTKEVRQRIEHVLGMMNYSLCLRNCEHVANYIYNGIWYSSQVKLIIKEFKHPMGENEKFINRMPDIPPVYLRDHGREIYSFLQDQVLFKPIEITYYLEYSRNTYNVLLIGPIGAGKSRLLNVLFNRKIIESRPSFSGVTKEITFVRGRKTNKEILPNFDEIILTDTIGLCDIESGEKRVHNYLKHRLNNNLQKVDIVLIVIARERISNDVEQNIRIMLQLLNYEKYSERFVFVITKSFELIDKEKKALRAQLTKTLSLSEKTKDDSILFTDFYDTDDFTEKQKKAIRNDFKALNNTIFKERQNERIPIKFELDGDKERKRSKPDSDSDEVKDYERSQGSKNDIL